MSRIWGQPTAMPWLDSLPWYAAARVTEVIGAVAEFGPHVMLRKLSEDQWQQSGARGAEIISRETQGIKELLDCLQRAFLVTRHDWGPKSLYGRLYEWLAHEVEDSAYDKLREVIREHAIATMPLGPGDQIFSKPITERRLHSVRSAALEIGAHPKRLKKLLHRAGLISPDQTTLTDDRIVFPAHLAAEVLEKADGAMSLAAAGRYLNIPRCQLSALYEEGILRPFISAGSGNIGSHSFSKQDLDIFLGKLLLDARLAAKPDATLANIPRAAKLACCSAAEIVTLILEQKLKKIARVENASGFLSVGVNVGEVKQHVRREDHGGVSLKGAEKQLGTSTKVLKALIEEGYLAARTVVNPINRCPQRVILQVDIDSFGANYIGLVALALKRGEHFGRTQLWLDQRGISPAFNSKLIGASFYQRSQITPNLRLD